MGARVTEGQHQEDIALWVVSLVVRSLLGMFSHWAAISPSGRAIDPRSTRLGRVVVSGSLPANTGTQRYLNVMRARPRGLDDPLRSLDRRELPSNRVVGFLRESGEPHVTWLGSRLPSWSHIPPACQSLFPLYALAINPGPRRRKTRSSCHSRRHRG